MRRLLCVLCIGFGLLPGAAAAGERLHIAVASNFHSTLRALLPGFETHHDVTVVVSSGSTGQLYAQIRQGAPFEVFLAADRARPARLLAEGRAVGDSQLDYAEGMLALWKPGSASLPALTTEALAEVGILALAHPELAPYGRAARQVLERLGIWDDGPRRVMGNNIVQAFQLVQSGNADAGLVALALLQQADIPAREYRLLPADWHAAVVQQAVLLKDTPAGRAFMLWLDSPPVRRRIIEAGYRRPAETAP